MIFFFRVMILSVSLVCFIFSPFKLYAYQVNVIIYQGKTAPVDLSDVDRVKGDLSDKDIKRLCVQVINAYYNDGYSGAYIEKAVVKRSNNTLVIHIHESTLSHIEIIANNFLKNQIELTLLQHIGKVYNEKKIKASLLILQKKYGIKSIEMEPCRNMQGNIKLTIKAKNNPAAGFYAKLQGDPLYGISPVLGYVIPANSWFVDSTVILGIKENDLSRIEGRATMQVMRPALNKLFYFELHGGERTERWESKDQQYTSRFVSPGCGLRSIMGIVAGALFFKENVSSLEHYPGTEKTVFDSRLGLDLKLSNKSFSLDDNEFYTFHILGSGGWESMTRQLYFMSEMKLAGRMLLLYDLSWLGLVPEYNLYYTTLKERFFLAHVYDAKFPILYDNFTASSFVNVVSVHVDVTVVKELLHVLPFVNSAYFINEYKKWQFKPGIGLASRIRYNNLVLELNYACETGKPLRNGLLSFNAGGKL